MGPYAHPGSLQWWLTHGSPTGWCTKRLLWKERTFLSLMRTRVLIALQLALFSIFPFCVSYQAAVSMVPKGGSWIKADIYSLAQLDVSANGASYERGSCTLQMTYICLNLANIFPVKITSVVTWESDFVAPPLSFTRCEAWAKQGLYWSELRSVNLLGDR